MNSPTAPTLVLDLDGTLIDTAGDLVAALNRVLALEGFGPIPFDEAVALVGHGARAMLAAALSSHRVEQPAQRLDRLTDLFIEDYGQNIVEHSRPFPGAVASLDRFDASGWQLAICTNKLERLSRLLLDRLDLADRFAVISGQDTFGVRKPDPGHLIETIRAAGGMPDHAVMVGDSEVDVAAAHAARIPVIAVAFGYSPVPAMDLGADRVIGHFDDLFDAATILLPASKKSAPSDMS